MEKSNVQFYTVDAKYRNTKVLITHKGEVLEFDIEILINRRLSDVFSPNMFTLLNKYVDWKGEGFKDELFKRYKEADELLMQVLTNQINLDEPPYELFSIILDMFDFNDMVSFIKKYNVVTPPAGLKDTFDKDMEVNKEGTRVQTYLKEDYIELAALLAILKSIIGPAGQFLTITAQQLPENYREYYLLVMLLKHPITDTPPFQKLVGYIEKLVQNVESNERELHLRIIEKGIDRETLPYHVLAGALFQNLLLADETQAVEKKNVVTKLYSYASNRLNIKNNPNSNIKLKQEYKTSPDASGEDTESVIESYRIPTELSIGSIEEFKFALSDVKRLYDWLSKEKNYELLNLFKHAVDNIAPTNLPVVNIKIAFTIIKSVINPRVYNYVDAQHVRNVLAVASTVLWENEFPFMAVLLSSSLANDDITKVNYNTKIKLTEYHKELLEERFKLHFYNKKPHTGEITKKVNVADEMLTRLTDMILDNTYINTGLPEDMIKQATGQTSRYISIPNDMKLRLLEALVTMEEQVG